MKKVNLKKFLLLCLPFIVSAAMLTVIQAPISLSPLAWISLVPFILACSPDSKPKSLALGAYLISLCYWLANIYWIAPITLMGWTSLSLYTALSWPILALCLRYCRIKKIPLFLAAPILFVGAERLRGCFFGGFFWRFLAHSQYTNITIIQIADIFGAAGVSFLIAMVNGLLSDLIIAARQKQLFKLKLFLKTAFVAIALLATILYGRWRINQSEKCVTDGPLIASLQSNVPQMIKREALRGEPNIAEKTSEEIFDELMQKSRAGIEEGADLVIWPETMVQATLNDEVLVFFGPNSQPVLFDKALSGHAANNAFLLIGAYSGRIEFRGNEPVWAARYNSAFLYRPDGSKYPKQYSKMHLVLFGEVLPFRKSSPFLFNILMKFNPYGYDHSLDAGTEYTVYEMTAPVKKTTPDTQSRPYKFSVIICYEATIPDLVRKFALDSNGQKKIDWLINISNDGWFVRFKGEKVLPSTELSQHMAICVFRSVENRLSIVRSVNTGISCIIDTLGSVKNGFLAGTLPEKAIQRTGVDGWFLDKLPIDKRETFFSKYGQWLDFCCALCLVLFIIVTPLAGFVRNKKYLLFSRQRQNEVQ
ncbi:MAG: apolipoprotein N-acyltransferase [Phycisphaerae bacterium]|nr:apolipoprotein N-acyltransferase [Phycisphaerae bacterium]NIW70360.1 apolipoprotein N-acyltransferase [candidate division KSB1 bacterium]NIP56389.1 apolipoprotein N-acyltransferase [Phycisphaerae bacterium]NIS54838.1 apolipoprotein N-acyltransferase [Phycisphaerae bacterium]NIU12391.1 apolipoprotein N-acyltransferase [Phycisphaerae bacterium]